MFSNQESHRHAGSQSPAHADSDPSRIHSAVKKARGYYSEHDTDAVRSRVRKDQYTCTVCEKLLFTRDRTQHENSKRHIRKATGGSGTPTVAPVERYSCSHCFGAFTRQGSVARHERRCPSNPSSARAKASAKEGSNDAKSRDTSTLEEQWNLHTLNRDWGMYTMDGDQDLYTLDGAGIRDIENGNLFTLNEERDLHRLGEVREAGGEERDLFRLDEEQNLLTLDEEQGLHTLEELSGRDDEGLYQFALNDGQDAFTLDEERDLSTLDEQRDLYTLDEEQDMYTLDAVRARDEEGLDQSTSDEERNLYPPDKILAMWHEVAKALRTSPVRNELHKARRNRVVTSFKSLGASPGSDSDSEICASTSRGVYKLPCQI